MSDIPGLLSLYSQTAPYYEQQVIPIFAPLARDLSAWIVRCVAAHQNYALNDPFDLDEALQHLSKRIRAIDIGTGTGILARTLVPSIGTVIGVDLSPAMLAVARSHIPDRK